MRRTTPHIKSIPPGAPFIPTLVDNLLAGQLIEGFAPQADPLALSTVTIWVPTRRAVRSLRDEFVTRGNHQSSLLPNIRALGDTDDERVFGDLSLAGDRSLQAIINPLDRHLILSQLVFAWAENLNPKQRALFQGADIIMPSSLGDAVRFASDLARLMDTVATEEADWSELNNLVPLDHAQWWQLTLEFLKIATSVWPDILNERGLVDGATARAQQIRQQAHQYETLGSKGPVIAAGSTGSIPTTADLLRSIAHLEQGVVVLSGLDRDIDDETWEKIDLPDNPVNSDGTAPGHPQYGLKQLLHHLGAVRMMGDIRHLQPQTTDREPSSRIRETVISESLRPSQSTDHWQIFSSTFTHEQKSDAFSNVTLIEARAEREEALAVAVALRETLETETASAALVTPDRNLARRVAAEMRRFGIAVDDSAGQPLRNTSHGRFMRLVLQVAYSAPDPIALVSLIKHPLARFGATAARARHAARLFELAILRGAIEAPKPGEFHSLFSEVNIKAHDEKARVHRAIRRFSPQDWDDLNWISQTLDTIFSTSNPADPSPRNFSQLVTSTISKLERCGRDENDDVTSLYNSESGGEIFKFLNDLQSSDSDLMIAEEEWPDIVDALMASSVTRPVGGTHPRVAILGPLEARLQSFDRIVLGGLNEKVWPASARNDPFLSRPMKMQLGLPTPERRTGLAAHDFQILTGMKDVVLSRPLKADNTPMVASRWLQRLEIVLGEKVTDEMRERGQKYVGWSSLIDEAPSPTLSCQQPRPTPPTEMRPKSLSVTEIATWVEDPYAIYARHILQLDPLSPLLREADARERGTLYHDILEEFVKSNQHDDPDHGLAYLLDLARHHFNTARIPDEFSAKWWPRFQVIAENFVTWHRDQITRTDSINVELAGNTDSGLNGFTLRGRADRIDQLRSGALEIFDYKTGNNPTAKHVREAAAPQLPLEAAMAARGAFGPVIQASAAALGYIRLKADDEMVVDLIGDDQDKHADASDLSEDAWKRLSDLVEAYRDPEKDYRSKARPISDAAWESDYDHLARVKEWSVSDDGEATD